MSIISQLRKNSLPKKQWTRLLRVMIPDPLLIWAVISVELFNFFVSQFLMKRMPEVVYQRIKLRALHPVKSICEVAGIITANGFGRGRVKVDFEAMKEFSSLSFEELLNSRMCQKPTFTTYQKP